jgi:hypothetical protein
MFTICYADESVTQVWEHVVQPSLGTEDPSVSSTGAYADGYGGVAIEVNVFVPASGTTEHFWLWLDSNGNEIWRGDPYEGKTYFIIEIRPKVLTLAQEVGSQPKELLRVTMVSTGIVEKVSVLPAPKLRIETTGSAEKMAFDNRGFFKIPDSGTIVRYDYIDQPAVIVAPSTIGTDESNYIVSWSSITGRQYKVQSTPDLLTPVWTDQSIFLSGTGSTMSYAKPVTAGPIYFRVIQE